MIYKNNENIKKCYINSSSPGIFFSRNILFYDWKVLDWKINLCLYQNKVKKRYQAENKIILCLNQSKIKKDTRQILKKRKENFPWNQRDQSGFQKIQVQGEATS